MPFLFIVQSGDVYKTARLYKMKKKNVLLAVASFLMLGALIACGSSRKTSTSAYVYPSQEIHSNNVSQQPKMRKREVDECITMANSEPSDRFRAYGTSSSYQEEYALQNAEANAVTAMVQRMQTAIEGARQFFNKNANVNTKKMTEGDAKSVITQYIVGKCKNYRVIKTNLYDLSDGSIRCYVCIEMRDSKDEVTNTVSDALSRDNLIELEYDKKQFIESMKQGLEDYKKQQMQE